MKTKYDKIAKHITRINELLGVKGPYSSNATLSLTTMRELKVVEDSGENDAFAFTSNGLDKAVRSFTGKDY